MDESGKAQDCQTRVGRLAIRALIKLLDGLRASEARVVAGDVEPMEILELPLIDWPIDVGEPCELSEEELLILSELAEEQDDPFVPPLRPCRAIRRHRAQRARRLTLSS
jgi:hypothetical protein